MARRDHLHAHRVALAQPAVARGRRAHAQPVVLLAVARLRGLEDGEHLAVRPHAQPDVEVGRAHAGNGRHVVRHFQQVVALRDEAGHARAAVGVDRGLEVGAGVAGELPVDALRERRAGGRRPRQPVPQQEERGHEHGQRGAGAQHGAVAPAHVGRAARVGHAVGLGRDVVLREAAEFERRRLQLPAVQVLQLAELALVARLEVVLALEAVRQRMPVDLAHRVVLRTEGREVVEELAVRVVGVEQLHLQRRGAVHRIGVAPQDLVEPRDHGEGGRFDLRGGGARHVGVGACDVQQAQGLALGVAVGEGGAASRDRCVQAETEGNEGREAVEQAGHEGCPLLKRALRSMPCTGACSDRTCPCPRSLEWAFIFSTGPRGRHTAWGLCRWWGAAALLDGAIAVIFAVAEESNAH
ncbi:hypothetical protein D9M72_365900 [compost metagenome]